MVQNEVRLDSVTPGSSSQYSRRLSLVSSGTGGERRRGVSLILYTVFNSGQMGSTLMGSLQKYYFLTEKTFGYSRQNYVPLCVLYLFEQGIFNLIRASRTRMA